MQPDGLSAIYAALDQKGEALRWEMPPGRLPDAVGRLVVWDPGTIKEKDWKDLLAWVARGHTLIIADDSSGRAPGYSRPPDTALAASTAAADPVTVGLGEIATSGRAFTTIKENMLTLLTRPDGSPVLVTYTQGKGRVYWSADTAWLSNESIGKGSNLDLAVRLLAPGDGRMTAFSEYDHGYQAAERWWELLRGSLQWFVAVLALAGAVLFWAYGARFGAPVPVPARPFRASVEYVYSMSQLYRRARARTVVTKALYRSLTRDLSRLLGGIQGLSHAEIAHRTAERTGLPAEQVQGALDRTAPGSAYQPNDKDLILLARDVEAIQRSVHNAGYRDQRRPGTGAK